MDIFFNEVDDSKPLKTNPLKIPNDPSRKSRRMVNMIVALIKTIRYADSVVRNHFSNAITPPTTPISNSFCLKVGEFAALMKYIISCADSGDAHNVTLYRLVCIITKAALRLHETDPRLYGVLCNQFIW